MKLSKITTRRTQACLRLGHSVTPSLRHLLRLLCHPRHPYQLPHSWGARRGPLGLTHPLPRVVLLSRTDMPCTEGLREELRWGVIYCLMMNPLQDLIRRHPGATCPQWNFGTFPLRLRRKCQPSLPHQQCIKILWALGVRDHSSPLRICLHPKAP